MTRVFFTAMLLAETALFGVAQNAVPNKTEPSIGSVPYLLARHHVELTEAALLQALQNENAEVRWLAASELAAEHDHDAIPAIEMAMHTEPESGARLNLAYALAQLGEQSGIATVRSTCDDRSQSDALRVRAIKYIADLKRGDCIQAALDLSQSNSPASAEALSLLPRFELTSVQQKKIEQAAQSSLLSGNPMSRRVAAEVLLRLKDVTAIPALTEAMNGESDGVARNQMKATVSALQALKK